MTPLLTLQTALASLGSNKLRAGLTLLGVVIGVAAVITALAVGPGLGGGCLLSERLSASLRDLWKHHESPMVYDADALPAIGGEPNGARVITPHAGEAGRLLGFPATDVQADRFAAATALVNGYTVILKGRNSLVASPGELISVNPTGGPVLATAGSGDVLCGIVGAILARGQSARDAARLGAWVHGAAADILATERAHGWTAGDIADAVPRAIGLL
jgi:NAD(P)H-hydrate epimerase